MSYVGFVDVISAKSGNVPAVKGLGIIALYATGSSIIEATAAEIARFRNAGVGVVLIDQTPSQSVLAAGLADIGDIESLAGTYSAAAAACKARAKHGWHTTLYVGDDNLGTLTGTLRAEDVNMDLVQFGVANYNWSVAEAESLLAGNSSWAYCQYGDNITNAGTKIPGTEITCGEAGCDIDVAKASWADQFMPSVTTVRIPVTFGERASTAIAKIEAAGLKVITNPDRNPDREYISIGSKPKGGTEVPKGSTITLGVKEFL